MSVEQVPTELLKANSFAMEIFENLAPEDRASLKKDIEKNGIRIPLEILPDYTIIDGHQRLSIAKELGLPTVPCTKKELSEIDAKIWIITANLLRRQLKPEQKAIAIAKLSELYENPTGADHTSLEFRKQKQETESDSGSVWEKTAEKTGVSPSTVRDYRAYAKAVEAHPEFKGKPIIATLNEVKRLEDIEKRKQVLANAPEIKNLQLGDALEKIIYLDDTSIDLLLIDAPYGISFVSNHPLIDNINRSMESDSDAIFTLLSQVFSRLERKLKSDSFIYVFTSWKTIARLIPIMQRFFEIRNVLVWDKGNWTGGDLYNNFADSYELIVFAAKGKKQLNLETRPRNLLFYTRPTNNPLRRFHPTEKPVELLKQLIQYGTVEGETVLDCFAGSGSTLIAAEELGRNWIGIEIDPEWFEIAKMRIHELRQQKHTITVTPEQSIGVEVEKS